MRDHVRFVRYANLTPVEPLRVIPASPAQTALIPPASTHNQLINSPLSPIQRHDQPNPRNISRPIHVHDFCHCGSALAQRDCWGKIAFSVVIPLSGIPSWGIRQHDKPLLRLHWPFPQRSATSFVAYNFTRRLNLGCGQSHNQRSLIAIHGNSLPE